MSGDMEQRVQHMENQIVNLNAIVNKLLDRVKKLEAKIGLPKTYEKNLISVDYETKRGGAKQSG